MHLLMVGCAGSGKSNLLAVLARALSVAPARESLASVRTSCHFDMYVRVGIEAGSDGRLRVPPVPRWNGDPRGFAERSSACPDRDSVRCRRGFGVRVLRLVERRLRSSRRQDRRRQFLDSSRTHDQGVHLSVALRLRVTPGVVNHVMVALGGYMFSRGHAVVTGGVVMVLIIALCGAADASQLTRRKTVLDFGYNQVDQFDTRDRAALSVLDFG